MIDRETFEHPAPAEPVKAETLRPLDLNSAPSPNDPANTDPRTSSSAPKATEAPKGSEIKVPSAQEVGKKVDASVEKGKQAAKDAERKAERAGDKVEEKAKEVKGASKQLARDASEKGRELADDAAEKTKEVANDVEKKAKQLKREAKVGLEPTVDVSRLSSSFSSHTRFAFSPSSRVQFALTAGRDPARRERRCAIH